MKNQTLAGVVLAGGFGTRIRHLYPGIPKPMIPVFGVPFLEWVIRYFQSQGILHISVSCGYLAESIKAYLVDRKGDAQILTVVEDAPMGTGGGFLLAENVLPGAEVLVVTNGDSLIVADLKTPISSVAAGVYDCAIIGRWSDDCSRYGSLDLDNENCLRGFSEKRPGKGIINCGLYIFRKEIVRHFPRKLPLSLEYDVFPELLSLGCSIRVFITDAPFIDIGIPETLKTADDFVRRNLSEIGP